MKLTDKFYHLQTVLDSERGFQQDILPRMFNDGALNWIDVRREVTSYIGGLMRKNWDVYSYLDDALIGSNEDQESLFKELAFHWEIKYSEGCYE